MLLEIRGLQKSFGNKLILKNINLDVQKAQVIAILGPSGSGKSTFLRCINLLEKPNSGYMRLGDLKLDFKHLHKTQIAKARRSVAMVFQNYNLFNNKTALQNITEGLIYVRGMNAHSAKARALELLEKVGLTDKANIYPHSLSGGQAQRVSIARALALEPKILLLDEPTSALDIELVAEVLNVIKLLCSSQTMIIVTHELEFARSIAEHVVFMSDGEIIENLATEDFFDTRNLASRNPRIQKFLAKFNGFNEDFCI